MSSASRSFRMSNDVVSLKNNKKEEIKCDDITLTLQLSMTMKFGIYIVLLKKG